MAKKSSAKNENRSINFWQMVRDVLIAALSKGQFPLALLGFILMLIIVKMPGDKVSELAFEIFKELKSQNLIGIVISPIIGMGWFFHIRWQRRIFTKEIHRVSEERNHYQQKLIGENVNSSRG